MESSTPISSAPSAPGSLPGIVQLLTESKNLVMRRLGFLLSLTLVTELFGPLALGGLVFLTGAGAMFVYTVFDTAIGGLLLGLLTLGLLIGAIYANILFSIAPLLAISDESRKSIKQAVLDAKPMALSYFIAVLVMSILITIGFILLVIPGVYLLVVLAFSVWFVVLEGAEPIDSLKKSKELVQGRWMAVFGRLLVFGAIVWLAVVVPPAILEAIGLEWLGFIYTFALVAVVTPLGTAYLYLLFKGLKQTFVQSPVQG